MSIFSLYVTRLSKILNERVLILQEAQNIMALSNVDTPLKGGLIKSI